MATFLSELNMKIVYETIRDNEMDISFSRLTAGAIDFYNRERYSNKSLFEMNASFIMEIYTNSRPMKMQSHAVIQTIEEIKSSEFDERLKQKEHEYNTDILKIKPPVPVFAFEEQDKPINEIDELIKQTISQRNFEIEQIYQATDPPPPTSSSSSSSQKKHITWKDEKLEGGENILSKLKKIELPNSNDIIVKELQDINKKLDELLSLTRSK